MYLELLYQPSLQAIWRGSDYVAVIGDGVNDAVALKTEDASIAMESGSGAARGIPDLVLLNGVYAMRRG